MFHGDGTTDRKHSWGWGIGVRMSNEILDQTRAGDCHAVRTQHLQPPKSFNDHDADNIRIEV